MDYLLTVIARLLLSSFKDIMSEGFKGLTADEKAIVGDEATFNQLVEWINQHK